MVKKDKKIQRKIMGQRVFYLMSQKWAKGVYSVKCPVTSKTSFLNITENPGKVWVRNAVLNIYMIQKWKKWLDKGETFTALLTNLPWLPSAWTHHW